MILHLRARPYTAFTVPGMGHFQWVTSPRSLLGCPASFQRLMETIVNGISNVIVYINDLLVHLATHEEHLATLGQVLKSLIQIKIKINLQKCIVIDAPQSGLKGLSRTLNKTIKMRYYAQVRDSTFVAKARGESQE